MDDEKFSQSELHELFGGYIPIYVIKILMDDSIPLASKREQIYVIANNILDALLAIPEVGLLREYVANHVVNPDMDDTIEMPETTLTALLGVMHTGPSSNMVSIADIELVQTMLTDLSAQLLEKSK